MQLNIALDIISLVQTNMHMYELYVVFGLAVGSFGLELICVNVWL